MRILHAISTLAPSAGGPAVAVVAMARAVAALGHEISIHATDFGMAGDSAPASGAVGNGSLRISIHRHLPPGALTRHASIGLWRALEAEIPKADIVHLHSLYMFHDWAAWRACRRAGVPYILRPHGMLDPFIVRRHRWRKAFAEFAFQNQVTRGAALIHYTSELERDLAQPYVFGRPGAVVPLGVDFENFEPMPSPAMFRLRHPEIGQRNIVLFLGRLSFKKGLEILIPAFAAAIARQENLHLVIAGPDDGFESQARALVTANNIARRTTFTGSLARALVAEAYAAAGVFVLPSRQENFGIAAAEAMTAGTPALLSDQVHIAAEAARHGACRVLPLDVNAWTEAILGIFSAPDEARLMGDRARKHALQTFDWQTAGRKLADVYERVIANRAG